MKFEELKSKILAAQDAYYNGEPVMSDAEFDMMWDEAKRLNPEDEIFTSEVGADHTDGFEKAKHTLLMGSQSKANKEVEMDDFLSKTHGPYIGQYKCDGISLELTYENGYFKKGITRGDGIEGDDITANVSRMKIPHVLSKKVNMVVRGEILLFRDEKDEFFPEMKNCRNAASGIAKHLDGADCEHLSVVVYDARMLDGENFKTQVELQNFLEETGFEVAKWVEFDNLTGKECMDYMHGVFEGFDDLAYDMDGIVWKQNEIDLDDLKTNMRPKTQIALKPARIAVETEILDIEWNCVNGTFTPIAIFSPITLQGSTIQRASMANVAQMMTLDIEIGDKVEVVRAGMIIPKIIKNITKGKELAKYCED